MNTTINQKLNIFDGWMVRREKSVLASLIISVQWVDGGRGGWGGRCKGLMRRRSDVRTDN